MTGGGSTDFSFWDGTQNVIQMKRNGDLLFNPGGDVGVGTTNPDRLLHAEVSDAVTSAITYAARLSHATSGTAAALFGVGLELELEDAGGAMQVASEMATLWADASAGAESPLLRFTTYPIGSAGPGYCGFWTWQGIDDTARTIIPNGTGDVTKRLYFRFVYSSSGGSTGVFFNDLVPGNSDSYSIDGSTFVVNCALDGSVTMYRSSGERTLDVSMWLLWI